jgi:N5-(cytidine 5'-diphosphoramidyl)-L-glutamine hydrolase
MPMSKIALSMRMVNSDYGEWRDAIAQDWTSYLHAQDIQPVHIPNDPAHCTKYLDGVSALILTGGDEIILTNPDEKSDDPRARRDLTEYALLKHAIEKNLPVLGVCRGIQFINTFFGGTLKKIEGHVATTHEVIITDNSIQSLFPQKNMSVNSFHDNSIDTLGKDLLPFATSNDGNIEGLVHSKYPIVGIMWHPERPEQQSNLISRFLKASQ